MESVTGLREFRKIIARFCKLNQLEDKEIFIFFIEKNIIKALLTVLPIKCSSSSPSSSSSSKEKITLF